MPTLHWIGKEKIINHHLDVPFRTLRHEHAHGQTDSGNRIIHGDNLEALKALLPEYEGRVKCIYIDPPYNTGNEGWAYNDNVSDPRLLRWLNKMVGKEGEDLARHDKWLCLMYPRIRLLHKLLAEDGVIFVSIDDNEIQNLRPIMDEIFGSTNRIEQFIWKKSYGGGAKERYAVTVHEYVLMYGKNKENIKELSLPPDPNAEARYYKLTDEKLSIRGPFRIKPLEATKSMDRRENLVYFIPAPDGTEVWPKRQWWWAKERAYTALENNDLYFIKTKDETWSISYKQYLRDQTGEERRSKPFSIIDGIYNQVGSATLREIFDDQLQQVFQFPKPTELIEKLLSMIELPPDSLILDSFAGSGTTAHAVLNLNQQDGGNRKFILIEMEDYADTLTAERVRRVIDGYADKPGTGGGFDFYSLGEPLFDENDFFNPSASDTDIRRYVWHAETRQPWPAADAAPQQEKHPWLLGTHDGTDWWFCYDRERAVSLDIVLLGALKKGKVGTATVVYADYCTLPDDLLKKENIRFKKIPRDVPRL